MGRRENLKAVIQPEFRRLFAATKNIGEEYVFGEDLTKEVKELEESSKVVSKITSCSSTYGDRKNNKFAGTPCARGGHSQGGYQNRGGDSSIFFRGVANVVVF